MTFKLGLYEGMSEDVYHADPCDEPSLSSTIAADLLKYTPRHIWSANKRLNPDYEEEQSDAKDKGKTLHDLILLGENKAEILDFPDWRTKLAREAKKAAIESGKIPILKEKWPEYEKIRTALFEQISLHKEHSDALKKGLFEASLFVKINGMFCRCRFDHVDFDTDWIDDYKTTGQSIEQWINGELFSEAKDIQAAHYSKCYEAHTGRKPKGFRYVVQETFAPYCMAIVELDIHAFDVANESWGWSFQQWEKLIKTPPENWKGYSKKTYWASIPSWAETKRQLKFFNEEAE